MLDVMVVACNLGVSASDCCYNEECVTPEVTKIANVPIPCTIVKIIELASVAEPPARSSEELKGQLHLLCAGSQKAEPGTPAGADCQRDQW